MPDYTDTQLNAAITALSAKVATSVKTLTDAVTTLKAVNTAQQVQIDKLIGGIVTPPPTGDTTPPSVPSGVTAIVTGNTIVVAWKASTDAVGVTSYRVTRNGTQIAATAALTVTDTTPVAGTAYSYVVTALDQAGNVSAGSTAVSATVPAPPPPTTGVTNATPFTGRWKEKAPATISVNQAKTDLLRNLACDTWLNSESYSVPVYVATTSDPMVTVTPDWARPPITCRIPAAAVPAAGTDGTMNIIQPDGWVVDIWTAKWVNSTNIAAGRVLRTRIDGSGFGPQAGIRAAGCSTLGGLIRIEDIDAGKIDHALAIAAPWGMLYHSGSKPSDSYDYYYMADGTGTQLGYVAPATEQDYDSAFQYKGNIPIGSRVVMPRSVSIDSLGLNASEKMIAVAMQEYGGYILDTTGPGPMTWYAETAVNTQRNDWLAQAYGTGWGAQGLKKIRANLVVVA